MYGGTSLTLYSLSLAHVNDQIPSSEMVGASSTLILLNGGGAFVGPLFVAALMDLLGNDAFLPILAGLHLVLAGYALIRMGRRAPLADAEQTPFVGTPPGTSSSGELMGRSGD